MPIRPRLLVVGLTALGCHPPGSRDPEAAVEAPRQLVESIAGQLGALDHDVDLERITVEVRPAQEIALGIDGLLELATGASYYDGMLALRRASGIDPAYADGSALRAEVAAMRTPGSPALYDPNRRTIVLRNDAAGDELERAVARALVHAFQDQRLGGLAASLYAPDAPADEARARQCVLEGHAAFVARVREVGPGKVRAADFPDPGRTLGTDVDRPCPEGARYVADVYAKGGWPAVLRAVSTPPASTEMLLHPQKRDVDFPVHVELPQWPEEKLGTATVLRRDTMGELNVQRLLLERGFPRREAVLAATGWDGDHLEVYELATGENVVLWRTLWDREEDADAFRRAMNPKKETGAVAWRVAHRGRLVQAVSAVDDEVAGVLRDTLGGVVPPAEEPDDVSTTAAAEAALRSP